MRFDSLREISMSLLAESRKLRHLGIKTQGYRRIGRRKQTAPESYFFEAIYRHLYVIYHHRLCSDSRIGKTP
jgi:hypothetical protein